MGTSEHTAPACMRCTASAIDAQAIHATTADGSGTVVIDYRAAAPDFAYLQKLVRPGMRLNLLDCHAEGHTVVPGVVVVEPDFLIDISSLAACFTDYGHHPLVYTLNRLKERPNTQATLLGNFAGTALDDIIRSAHTHHRQHTTAHSLQRSFREQALRFCACQDFNAEKFKALAEEQVQNIAQAIDLLAPTAQTHFLLEPSFVCERLGLQGRVDLMTTLPSSPSGKMLLVEQKSGRNMKIEHHSHDAHGLQLESHYVQLLLYYAVLHYNFGLANRQADTRLLYSRYPAAQGLLAVGYYHTLLLEALRLRNQVVCTELLIARDGFGRIAPLLNADTIYKGTARDEHFHRYVQPGLSRMQQRLEQLSTLERTYLERMLTSVYREQVAAKLGSSVTRLHDGGGCASDLWLMPLSEKLATGNILTALSIVRHEDSTLTLAPAAQPQPGAMPLNFRQGDMVSLYAYDGTPDVRQSIVYKGTLQSLDADGTATVVLNEEQAALDRQRPWAMEHGSSDAATGANIRSLWSFAGADRQRRDLLLGQRQPQADTSISLSRSHHPDYDAVVLGVRQARDYYLLQGPPGTGKTSMALRFMVDEELLSGGAVLLTAYTNRAVDEICAMLCQAGHPFLRLGGAASCDERFRPNLLDAALAHTHSLDSARHLIDTTRVIVATTSTLQAQPYILQLKRFTLAIVDEASQILEPAIIGLLASDAIGRFVLVGDHKQLPAVVQQEPWQTVVNEECLRAIGLDDCRQSLFERLLRWEQRQGRRRFTGILHSHGRMHPEVAAFALRHFYHTEQLHAVPLPHQQETALGYEGEPRDELDRLLLSHRVLFLPSPNAGDEPEEDEARLVADVLRRIRRFTGDSFDPQATVGVIVPYRRQIAEVRQLLADDKALHGITIDTVERYQGSQRDIIIYSLGISHPSQLDFITASTFTDNDGHTIDRKLNVALTRARRQMIVVGRPDLMARVPLLRELMADYGQYSNDEPPRNSRSSDVGGIWSSGMGRM